ncbi:hypothetical protein [Actinokineospora sp. UTMC 2448]|uniref:hypothetical protein n=1 Tax=Actinokineospora sp. UTMC 2448 TaxID=2268449 RepID=UPI0021647D58|nr:hypothetical protein [Actinokineospora sp. UTMC 2448]UVS80317.1 hypothetical protein Actkin_04067 [Actinokineospora sp. UTMC 2448]
MRARWLWGPLLLLAGCGSGPTEPATMPEIPLFTTTTPKPTPRAERKVPRDCGLVITDDDLAALKVKVGGGTQEVAGVPVPDIKRTARVDCYFGVPSGDRSKAALIVTLASYETPAAAQARVELTIADERELGAAVTEVAVGPGRGHYIEGASRMVVARHGRVTVVVDASPRLLPDDQARRVLPAIADRALTAPGGGS